MFCSKCGTAVAEGKFCTSCGALLEDAPSVSSGPVSGNDHPINCGLDSTSLSTASGRKLHYVVLQITLKEKFFGTGSGNLTELESVINAQAAQGYRLHTISTATSHSTGLMGGDRIQATLVFEKM